MEAPIIERLSGTLARLAANAELKPVLSRMRREADVLAAEFQQATSTEVPAFLISGNPAVLPEHAAHNAKQVADMLRLLGGGGIGRIDFVRDYARLRAEQRFPLEAILHAYRCNHKVFNRWMRIATADRLVPSLAEFVIEYFDAVSTLLSTEYVAQLQRSTQSTVDRRDELLSILLDGHDESDGRVERILRDAGYLDRRLSFCVAVASPVDPAELLQPERARRMADSVSAVLQGSSSRSLVQLRDNRIIIVLSLLRRVSGWASPRTRLASDIKDTLLKVGNAALIGISTDVPSTSGIPDAYREARLALEHADAAHRVVVFSEVPLRRLIQQFAGPQMSRLLPSWRRDLLAADAAARGALTQTLRAYADADMNVTKTSLMLDLHMNTVYARLDKISSITGQDPRKYHALTELLFVAESRAGS